MKDIFSSWRVPMSGKADALVERNGDYARESSSGDISELCSFNG